MKHLLATLFLFCVTQLLSVAASAQVYPASAKAIPLEPRYLARIELNSPSELKDALLRAQALANDTQPNYPIAFVLHGNEVYSLLNENRKDHPALFQLAEDLSQQNVVRIQVCNSWLDWKKINNGQLPDFIDQVEYAPKEIERLIQKEGYTYF